MVNNYVSPSRGIRLVLHGDFSLSLSLSLSLIVSFFLTFTFFKNFGVNGR